MEIKVRLSLPPSPRAPSPRGSFRCGTGKMKDLHLGSHGLSEWNLPSTVNLLPTQSIFSSILPRLSVWSQPQRLGTLSSHLLCTFMSHAGKSGSVNPLLTLYRLKGISDPRAPLFQIPGAQSHLLLLSSSALKTFFIYAITRGKGKLIVPLRSNLSRETVRRKAVIPPCITS